MQQEVIEALKKVVIEALPLLQELVTKFTRPYLEKRKGNQDQWHGTYVNYPNLTLAFQAASPTLNELGKKFTEIFSIYYPDYEGLVGLQGHCLINLQNDPSHILGTVLEALWKRYESFHLDKKQIDNIIEEFAHFVDSPTVRLRYTAILFNFRMHRESIQLTNDLCIRRLSEKEISERSNSVFNLSFRHHSIHEFALEGEFDEKKVLSKDMTDSKFEGHFIAKVRPMLDKAIIGLSTFQSGYVGYNFVDFNPTKFCPIGIGSLGRIDSDVPPGVFNISEDSIEKLPHHLELIFSNSDNSLDIACTRLTDAESRRSPQDRLLDAVVGLEAILLAGLSKDDRRSELKYRFSLNYSTLFETPEKRKNAYRVAKALYDLRSTIAHGSLLKELCPLGDKKLSLIEAAQESCQVLRKVIKYFLPLKNSPHKKPEFWENGYFGIEPRI